MSMLFCTSKPTNCKSTYIIIKINELNYNGKYIYYFVVWSNYHNNEISSVNKNSSRISKSLIYSNENLFQ